MYMFEYWGKPLTYQRIVPGNTAVGTIATSYYYTEWLATFEDGATGLAAGAWIVGASSAVVAQVISVNVTGGALGSNNATGTMRLKSKYHPTAGTTNWTASEDFNIGGADKGDLVGLPKIAFRQDPSALFPIGTPAKCALVTVLTNTELVSLDDGIPDQTTLAGLPMKDGSSILLRDIEEIINFKAIDYVASSAGVVDIQYFF